MKTLIFTSVIFFIVMTKEDCGDYYKYTAISDKNTEYVIYSTTKYNLKDTILFKTKK